MKITEGIAPSKPQHLIPVLTKDNVLRGFINIQKTSFSCPCLCACIGNRKLNLKALTFDNGKDKNTLMCAIFDTPMTEGNAEWNGIPNFISPAEFGIYSGWASPSGIGAVFRTTDGLVKSLYYEVFKSPTLQKEIKQGAFYGKTYSISFNASYDSLCKKFSCIEFDWYTMLENHFKKENISEKFLNIYCAGSDPKFKVFLHGEDKIPNIIRIMSIKDITKGSYDFLFKVSTDQYIHNLIIRLNIS